MIAAMSSLPIDQPSSTDSNQFIRPNCAFDVHSAAERLASRGEGFANSVEFAEAISGGVATDLAQALMTALGRRFDDLEHEDMMALVDLYTAMPSTRGAADEAAGSPASSCVSARSAKDSLSSFEDDLSLDGSLLGEANGTSLDDEPPVEVGLPVKMRELSIEDTPGDPPRGRAVAVATPPTASLSRSANERSFREMAAARQAREEQRRAAAEAAAQGDAGGEADPPGDAGANDAPGDGGGAGGGAGGGGGGGEDPDASESESESDEMDEDEEPEEDPSTGQHGKEYRPKTDTGKAMAKMFVRFCQLSRANARAIVVFFGVSSSNKLADFLEEHWKDTFAQWQKRHPCPDGTERAMVLSPPQQDRIRCAAWACRHLRRLGWPQAAVDPARGSKMIELLTSEHFEPIRAQMEREEEGKVTLKAIPDLSDVPTYRSTVTMSKHFRDFETYLSQHYGVEGFPLDYVVRSSLARVSWGDFETPRPRPGGKEPMPDFFKFEESDYQCRRLAPILDPEYEGTVRSAAPPLVAEYEAGKYADRRSHSFRRDDAIVFQLARVAFKDSPGEVHFIPRKGKQLQSGRAAYFACKGQFVGIHTARQETDLARDVISKMQYEGESRQWNWDKHCAKFHQQVSVIEEWAVAGLATRMSNEDQISAFLKTIPKDCKNAELVIAKGIIEGDRARFPTLIGNVIPHLSLSIETKERGAAVGKRTIANTNTGTRPDSSQRSPGKRRRRGGSRPSRPGKATAGKCRVENGRVVGTIEGLHYTPEIWTAMSDSQRRQVLELRRTTPSSRRGVRAAATARADAQLTAVSDSISQLTRAVKSLESSRGGDSPSADRRSGSRRRGARSRSGSSSRSRGTSQSGAHSGRRSS